MGLQLPPAIASYLTLALIAFLFWRDIREKPNVSGALWLPTIWLVITCSRSVSFWLNFFGLPVSGAVTVEEGSPLDASFYFIFIVAGFAVLNKRQVRLSELARKNPWLMIFFSYCLISVCWSDFPFVAFKRWIKVLGLPIMALVVLTERDPEEAVRRLMKRCAYVIVPVSVLFIKFYPQWGRAFEPWSGAAMSTGITDNKNALGSDCLIFGFFLFCHFLQTWRARQSRQRRKELGLIAGFLIVIYWLFSQAHSATSFISFLLGAVIVVFVGMRSVNKKHVGSYILTAVILLALAELALDASTHFSQSLGRGPGLSGRTLIWERLLRSDINPIFGTGFESFWLGERPAQVFQGLFFYIPNEAHNGYLEIYLTLGLLGVFLFIAWFVATFWKIRTELFRNFEWARYRLGFFAAIVVYNWTEAGFKTISAIWFMFCIIAIDYPRLRLATTRPSVGLARSNKSTDSRTSK
jgi:O-antigen ligase